MRSFTASLGLILLFCSSFTFANQLSIPTQLPDLNVTNTNNLGTLDDGVGLTVGTKVPSFTTRNHLGKKVSFDSLKSNGPLMVVFYRGGWCPYCNRQIRQLTESFADFKQRSVLPVLISVDKPEAAALASRTYEIPFPVLSDPDLVVHDLFHVTMELDKALIPKYKEYGIDIEQWSGKKHHKFAVASVFLINKKGVVIWSHSANDYTTRPSVKQLLMVIDKHADQL